MTRSSTILRLIPVLALLLASAVSADLPVSFMSAQHPKSLLLKMEVRPESQFKLKSGVMIRQGSHWTTVSSHGERLNLNPSPPQSSILFNQRHQSNYLLAFHGQLDVSNDRHLNYVEVDHQSETYRFLLPLFNHELPALRTDRLYRCQNVLVSVEWKGQDARIVAFSVDDHKWNILESIDGGYSSEDRGVRYAYALDKAHSQPIRVDIDGNKYCLIDKNTEPAAIRHNWSRQNYGINDILDLVEGSLRLRDKNDIDEL